MQLASRACEVRAGLQWALVSALDEVQQSFACEGRLAGSTATIVLQARLLPRAKVAFC